MEAKLPDRTGVSPARIAHSHLCSRFYCSLVTLMILAKPLLVEVLFNWETNEEESARSSRSKTWNYLANILPRVTHDTRYIHYLMTLGFTTPLLLANDRDRRFGT